MEKPQLATFTVTADTPHELARMLRRIADALEDISPATGPWPTESEPSSLGAPGDRGSTWALSYWEVDHVRELWARLETPGARRALRHLVANAGRATVDGLSSELGKEAGPALAGTLSPIGRAVSAMGAPPPFHRVRSRYEVDPVFARSFRAFVEGSEGEAAANG